ncbi:MAG TPA: hypothetical protein VHO01_03795 [Jatrophihabitans sp.]|nr:hypothetical protein [Jatrophihabitans sp.]
MNDIDFENELKQKLNRSIDAEVGPRRQPPAFQIPETQHRIRPWLVPLAAAAAVVVVVAGTASATHLLSQKHSTAPATPGPSLSVPPSPTTTPSISRPAPSSSHTAASTSAKPPSIQLTPVGNAQLALPNGWVARDFRQYLPPNQNPVLSGQSWCLTPSDVAPSTAFEACPIEFIELPLIDKDNLDPSFQGASPSNPEYCGHVTAQDITHTAGVALFGGRTAIHDTWGRTCPDTGVRHEQEQYVIPTGPGYVFFSGKPASSIQPALEFIGAHSQLSKASNAIPYYDAGTVQSITQVPGSYRVVLQRDVLPVEDAGVDSGPAQSTYYVPLTIDQSELLQLKVGNKISVYTDGTNTHDIAMDYASG